MYRTMLGGTSYFCISHFCIAHFCIVHFCTYALMHDVRLVRRHIMHHVMLCTESNPITGLLVSIWFRFILDAFQSPPISLH